ncbi:hypothetical protein [Pseudomonas plecoglossicida]|uniref:hypothetical protein n=1 Tax=Pseudomonas plecoglossicida TaxID=70775 RepID=UPI0015E2B274|nr:hypothetical protein [Pseudomonas plecoglossicida]
MSVLQYLIDLYLTQVLDQRTGNKLLAPVQLHRLLGTALAQQTFQLLADVHPVMLFDEPLEERSIGLIAQTATQGVEHLRP